MSLKNKTPPPILKKLSLDMFVRFSSLNLFDPKMKPYFIPAPSKKNKKDHAYFLAFYLSQVFGGTLLNPLRTTSSSQKKRSRKDRAFLKITNEGFTPNKRPVIFVDDVLTSGATARLSYQALKKPENFFIFTLAWKLK